MFPSQLPGVSPHFSLTSATTVPVASRNLLREHLHSLAARHPRTAFFLIQPPGSGTPLFTPSMGFGASLTALRYGYTSTKAWLLACGTELMRRLPAVA
jgi:hypothetical protein